MDQVKGLSRSSQLLAGAGLLLFIFLFFDWQQVTIGSASIGNTGWHGWGILVGLLTIALVLWEGAQIFGVKIDIPIKPALLSTGLAAGVLVFTVIKFLADNEFRHWPAWIGLILAIAIGVGGFMRLTGDGPVGMKTPGASPPAA